MVEQVAARAEGRLDAVIACAGVRWDFGDGSGGSDASTIVRVNYFGAVVPLLALRPLLARSPHPRAVLMSSTVAFESQHPEVVDACLSGDEERAISLCGGDGEAAYAGTKMAIARWARREAPTPDWAGAGIAVNVVAPALVATPMAPALTDELLAEQLVTNPFGGVGKAEDIASLLAWLTSQDNGFVSGQVVLADGAGDALARPLAGLEYTT